MASLDGADPQELDPVPEVPVPYLYAVPHPGSGDGLQGLDLIVPGG